MSYDLTPVTPTKDGGAFQKLTPEERTTTSTVLLSEIRACKAHLDELTAAGEGGLSAEAIKQVEYYKQTNPGYLERACLQGFLVESIVDKKLPYQAGDEKEEGEQDELRKSLAGKEASDLRKEAEGAEVDEAERRECLINLIVFKTEGLTGADEEELRKKLCAMKDPALIEEAKKVHVNEESDLFDAERTLKEETAKLVRLRCKRHLVAAFR